MNEEDLGKTPDELYKEGKISLLEVFEMRKRDIDFNKIYLMPAGMSDAEWRAAIRDGRIKPAKAMFDDMGIKIGGKPNYGYDDPQEE